MATALQQAVASYANLVARWECPAREAFEVDGIVLLVAHETVMTAVMEDHEIMVVVEVRQETVAEREIYFVLEIYLGVAVAEAAAYFVVL